MIATLAIALSSCSKNEITPNMTESNAMNFGTYLEQSTKAESETGFNTGDKFKVDVLYTAGDDLADATSPNIYMSMDELVVTSTATNTTWEYAPLRFWPNVATDKLSFFANTIASNTLGNVPEIITSGNKVTFNYTNPESSTTQLDLMAASVLNRAKGGDPVSTVNFQFNHLLSQINFTFKTAEDYSAGAEIEVKSVVINYADDFYADAVYEFSNTAQNTGSWTVGTNIKQAEETFTINPKATTATNVLNSTDAKTLAPMVPIMVIPQEKGITVTITYTIAETDGSNPIEQTFTSGELMPTGGFSASTIYTYPVSISLDAIVFGEATTSTWGTGGLDINI